MKSPSFSPCVRSPVYCVRSQSIDRSVATIRLNYTQEKSRSVVGTKCAKVSAIPINLLEFSAQVIIACVWWYISQSTRTLRGSRFMWSVVPDLQNYLRVMKSKAIIFASMDTRNHVIACTGNTAINCTATLHSQAIRATFDNEVAVFAQEKSLFVAGCVEASAI